MTDLPDQIRRLVDRAEPVTAAEARAAADTGAPTPVPHHRRRRRALVLVAVVVAAAATASLVVRWPSEPAQVDTTDDSGPTPTVLPTVGDDPLVSCESDGTDAFRVSAWSNPTGAENDGSPASEALRNYLALQQMASSAGVDPLVPGLPESPWRLLAADETSALWGAGELDLERVASEEIGPILSFVSADLVDGTWQYAGGGGGTCNELFVVPPEGMSPARWAILPADLPGPEDTEITLVVDALRWCRNPLTADDVAGPDVIETADAVTIRLAIDRPPRTDLEMSEEMSACAAQGDDADRGVRITVDLAAPLGDRQILDGNVLPAVALDLTPPEPEPEPDPAPRILVGDGGAEVPITVEETRDDCVPPVCLAGVEGASVTIAAGSTTASGVSDRTGRVVAVVPPGVIDVTVEAAGAACPPIAYDTAEPQPSLSVRCVRLDRPHATVEGTLTGGGDGDRRIVRFTHRERSLESVQTVTRPDGTFSVTLEAGPWRIAAASLAQVTSCSVTPRTLDVVAGVDQAIALTCS